MSVLNARVLARLRNMTERYLKDTCLIEVQQRVTDEYGSPMQAWSIIASDVPCRVLPIASSSMASMSALVGSAESLKELYKIICPFGTALAPDQRITVNGEIYNIIQLVTARTDETDTQALLTRQR